MLALIEKRFLGGAHKTVRDLATDTLENMSDFDNSPNVVYECIEERVSFIASRAGDTGE